jgi:hypothetical protein
MLTSRERVTLALEHREPDMVPLEPQRRSSVATCSLPPDRSVPRSLPARWPTLSVPSHNSSPRTRSFDSN